MANVLSGLRLGLTMRVVGAENYYEPRDAIAQDWTTFMQNTLPEVKWMPIPNIGNNIVSYVKNWKLNGFILTGGNDIGSNSLRDETETLLLKYAMETNIPILGVCRGLQLIASSLGHMIVNCENGLHSGSMHKINIKSLPYSDLTGSVVVNSYHDKCLSHKNDYHSPLQVFAFDDNGLVEGVWHKHKKLMAIMWHPEREDPAAEYSKSLIRSFFKKSNAQRCQSKLTR